MSPNKKKNYLAALRSGKYKHTSGVLFDGKYHCALGVLVDISPALFQVQANLNGKYYYKGKLSESFSFTSLHDKEIEALGLTFQQTHRISCLNDAYSNYDKVIQYIRTNL